MKRKENQSLGRNRLDGSFMWTVEIAQQMESSCQLMNAMRQQLSWACSTSGKTVLERQQKPATAKSLLDVGRHMHSMVAGRDKLAS